eukprot:scaffold47634_cov18-Tisochrysis_lutea.AAC.1
MLDVAHAQHVALLISGRDKYAPACGFPCISQFVHMHACSDQGWVILEVGHRVTGLQEREAFSQNVRLLASRWLQAAGSAYVAGRIPPGEHCRCATVSSTGMCCMLLNLLHLGHPNNVASHIVVSRACKTAPLPSAFGRYHSASHAAVSGACENAPLPSTFGRHHSASRVVTSRAFGVSPVKHRPVPATTLVTSMLWTYAGVCKDEALDILAHGGKQHFRGRQLPVSLDTLFLVFYSQTLCKPKSFYETSCPPKIVEIGGPQGRLSPEDRQTYILRKQIQSCAGAPAQ